MYSYYNIIVELFPIDQLRDGNNAEMWFRDVLYLVGITKTVTHTPDLDCFLDIFSNFSVNIILPRRIPIYNEFSIYP